MKANGRTIKLMAKECTCTLTEPDMKGSGKKTNSTGKAWRDGQMVPYTMGNTMRGRSTGEELSSGATTASLTENSRIIILKAMGPTNGTTAESTTATGRIIKCTGRESSRGAMGEDTLGPIKKT